MAEQNFRAIDILGLSPGVDPTQSDKIFALSGRNFSFDTRGPASVFGNRLLLPHKLQRPAHTQGIRLKVRGGDRCFTFANDAILEWNEIIGGWQVIYETPDTSNAPSRWTWGYLNDYLYFCHPRVGILAHHIESGVCRLHSEIGIATPDEALAITVVNGFLVVITPVIHAWSAPSNGLNFTPELGGAGFQVISDRVSGYPITVTSYTRGSFTWTTGGVMRSEFTGDQAVFRHRALQTEYRPVNPFCTAKIDDDTVVILDERGLFKSKGETPVPFTPVFNEFIAEYLQDNDINLQTNVRIEWDELKRRLYLSTSLSMANALYENCFVLHPTLDKWGIFSEPHYGILPLRINRAERADDYYGFVDSDGRVRYWQNTGSREVRPEDSTLKAYANLHYPKLQKPFARIDGELGSVLGSTAVANTFNDSAIQSPAAYYPWDGTSPLAIERQGLDAKIVFGLFRVLGQQSADQLGEITGLMIRNLSQENSTIGTVFNTDAPAALSLNLSQSDPEINERFLEEAYVNHGVKVIGTIDGDTEFASQVPPIIGFTKATRHYSCSVIGLWHMIELTADAVGESFHPVTFEFTATSAGRLN